MSSYIILHSCGFDRNQFRVLFDWFDFIHRCSFHSCWFCFLNQKYFLHWIYTVHSTQRSLCILLLIAIACCDTLRITIHFSIQSINSHQMTNKNINTQSRKMNNGKWSKRTASRLLSESPTLVLTRLVMTSLPRSDGLGRFPSDMAVLNH